jgi:hypothetical protein
MEDVVKVWQKVSTYETTISIAESVKKLVVEFQNDSTKVKNISVELKGLNNEHTKIPIEL